MIASIKYSPNALLAVVLGAFVVFLHRPASEALYPWTYHAGGVRRNVLYRRISTRNETLISVAESSRECKEEYIVREEYALLCNFDVIVIRKFYPICPKCNSELRYKTASVEEIFFKCGYKEV